MFYLDETSLQVSDARVISQLHDELSSLINLEEQLARIREVAKLQGVYRNLSVDHFEAQSIEVEGIKFTSRILKDKLETPQQLFPYVITLGSSFDHFSAEQNIWERYFLDTIANQIVSLAQESLIEYINQHHCIDHASRISPGSLKDWPLEEQKLLFDLLGREELQEHLGVLLTDNYLMKPTKSVSGIIFPTEEDFISCSLCPKENCPNRRANFDEQRAEKYEEP